MIKIEIFAPDIYGASRLAAEMNLSLRQWEYRGEHFAYPMMTWAYVEPLFDLAERVEDWGQRHAVHAGNAPLAELHAILNPGENGMCLWDFEDGDSRWLAHDPDPHGVCVNCFKLVTNGEN